MLAREAPEVPQTIKAIATTVGCIPKLDGETQRLCMCLVFDAGQGEIKLRVNWKLPPCCWLSWGWATQAAAGELSPNIPTRQQTLLKRSSLQTGCACLCNGGPAVIGKSNSLLAGFKAHFTRRGSYSKPRQKPAAGETVSSNGEAMSVSV